VGDDGTGEPVGRLRQVYGFHDPSEVREYYDAWAETYDAELRSNGYASPRRVAEAVAGLSAALDVPVLDYGCGTGLSGAALIEAGFTVVDGADPSERMLRVARDRALYRSLVVLDPDEPVPPFEPGSYDAVTAIGVIGPGAAPHTLLSSLLDVVAPGGLLGVSLNDLAMEHPDYRSALDDQISVGRAEPLFHERGPHLPGIDVRSTVLVLRRLHPLP
jgi:predicted TPR repeat methyltransferase